MIGLLAVDQISKYFFYDQELWSSSSFLEPFLNTGISRGIAMPQLLIIGIAFFCVLLFVYVYHKSYLTLWEVSLFMAGTIGNLIDRCFLGGVRDFVALGNFPIFNMADAFLTAAVILLCIREFLLLQRRKKRVS